VVFSFYGLRVPIRQMSLYLTSNAIHLKQLIYFILVLFAAFPGKAQELLPFTENFTKSDYNGDNQQWSITQGSDHAMYFANNHYLLRYNGVRWEKYTLPNKTIIRSVFSDGDRIYSGSYKEFGYWQRSEGRLVYTSLSDGINLFTGESENEEIWKIFRLGNEIWFQSFNELFIYDGKQINKKRLPFQISYAYLIDGVVYLASVRQGIYKLQDGAFIKMENWAGVDGNIVHHIGRYSGKVYVFTKSAGIFTEEEGQMVPWQHPLNEKLKSETIIAADITSEGSMAVGTGLKGLYLINMINGQVKNINRTNALKNNAILTITSDREGDLWLGLDNGIARVAVNAPVKVFSDNTGLLGSVYALSPYNSGYLFGTNHGLFHYDGKNLKDVAGTQGQVWNIHRFGTRYIVGHNDGTIVFENGRASRANDVTGGWDLVRSDFRDLYFQATYSGIACYPDINKLSNFTFLKGLTKPIRYVAQNKPNELWAADNYRSLYRVLYDNDLNVTRIENVSQKNGIMNDYGVKLFKYKNEVVFLIDKWWYSYNPLSAKLEKNKIFNDNFRGISDISPIDEERFVVLKAGLLYVISQKEESFSWEIIPQQYYRGKLIPENINITAIGPTLLINLDDGFISYNSERQRVPVQVVIEGFSEKQLVPRGEVVEHNRTVEIDITSGYYGHQRPELYYRLNSDDEYNRIVNGRIVLNNLSSGRQTVNIYTYDGNTYTFAADYKFSVALPWYFSFWMVLLYLAFIATCFYLYYKWNKIRYTQKLLLQQEELKHEKHILELELKAENDLNVQQYEKHILELEVQAKSSEVAGKSLSIAKQTELIDSIQRILETENEIGKVRTKIRNSIKANSINKNEWQSFERNLLQSNEEFVQKLSKQYPQLTARDIKLCIFLRMNMASKEIAPLMNISFRGVELHRYRLRKKLELPAETNLTKFMINL
jgi:AraC family chitin signaling transcriptional activator